jgi:hypothetical protein
MGFDVMIHNIHAYDGLSRRSCNSQKINKIMVKLVGFPKIFIIGFLFNSMIDAMMRILQNRLIYCLNLIQQ